MIARLLDGESVLSSALRRSSQKGALRRCPLDFWVQIFRRLVVLAASSLKRCTPNFAIPRPSTGPRSPDSPKLLRRLAGKFGVLEGVLGELLQRLPVGLQLRSRETAVPPAVSAAVLPALPPAPRISPAVSAAVWGNPGFGAL